MRGSGRPVAATPVLTIGIGDRLLQGASKWKETNSWKTKVRFVTFSSNSLQLFEPLFAEARISNRIGTKLCAKPECWRKTSISRLSLP